MIPIALIIGLFAVFVLASKHAGPTHLASIAGVAVNEMFGRHVTDFIVRFASDLPREAVSNKVYIALVLGFPIILYLKSAKEKRSLFCMVEYAIYAVLTAELIILPFTSVLATDELGKTCVKIIEATLPYMIAIGTATSYWDILRYKSHKKLKGD
jgi:hypothetical protein